MYSGGSQQACLDRSAAYGMDAKYDDATNTFTVNATTRPLTIWAMGVTDGVANVTWQFRSGQGCGQDECEVCAQKQCKDDFKSTYCDGSGTAICAPHAEANEKQRVCDDYSYDPGLHP